MNSVLKNRSLEVKKWNRKNKIDLRKILGFNKNQKRCGSKFSVNLVLNLNLKSSLKFLTEMV